MKDVDELIAAWDEACESWAKGPDSDIFEVGKICMAGDALVGELNRAWVAFVSQQAIDDDYEALLEGEPESVEPAPLHSRLVSYVKRLKAERDLPCAHRLEAERLESAIKMAMLTSGGRWDEWGGRAQMVADILYTAINKDPKEG